MRWATSRWARVVAVLRNEGASGLARRLWGRLAPRVSYIDLLLFGRPSGSTPSSQHRVPAAHSVQARARQMAERFLHQLDFRRINLTDTSELEELTKVDPWKIPREVSEQKLREGWRCYVVKHGGRIVANGWITTNAEFYDTFLQRTLMLAPGEVLHWRNFCIPDYRGRGILPWLSDSIVAEVTAAFGPQNHIGFVRRTNEAMRGSLGASGWAVIGHIGFVEMWGVRLHYVTGRNAFRAMRRRITIKRREE